MNKFEDILNHQKDNIFGGGRFDIKHPGINVISMRKEDRIWQKKEISLNDLLSPESGFLQAVKWKEIETPLQVFMGPNGYSPFIFQYSNHTWEYHAMILSILSQEDKIKYLEENIIVE